MKNSLYLFGEKRWRLLQAVLLTVLFTSIPSIAAAQSSVPDAQTRMTARDFIKVMGDLYRSNEGIKNLPVIEQRLGVRFSPKTLRGSVSPEKYQVHEALGLPIGIKSLEWILDVSDQGPSPQKIYMLTIGIDIHSVCMGVDEVEKITNLPFPPPSPSAGSNPTGQVFYRSYLSTYEDGVRGTDISTVFDPKRCLGAINSRERIFTQGEKK